jgi:hypothetical protein
MKRFGEFLLENELEDLRKDLLNLGYSRKEVKLSGAFIYEDTRGISWECEYESVGYGDTEILAASYALSALIKCLKEDLSRASATSSSIDKMEESAKRLVPKIVNRSFKNSDLSTFLMSFAKGYYLDIKILDYDGDESEGECVVKWHPEN